MHEIQSKLKADIQDYINRYPCTMEWDYRNIDSSVLKEILEKGLQDYENDLWETNIDYIGDQEFFFRESIYDTFKDELMEDYRTNKDYKDENDEFLQDVIMEDLRENFEIYCDTNIQGLLNMLPDITCVVPVYSNYDCTNSFDTMKTSEYMLDVYRRTKTGVKKDDFITEHQNGAYGGSLFCFVFKTDIKTFLGLKEEFKTSITIPKGTQFGFHSSFQGASSMFEKETYRNMTLKKEGESKYDTFDIIADLEQNYSLEDVFGGTDFVNESNVTVS